ncbi:MAG: hypothetical protein F2690_05275 [Actinobacteria bacterium]|uniref:Unannotated protein n=1 Tax=freshwater metagenome TaxID=449393 RepID=A0A6J6SHG3_9ZZZZ|nr:hypothetical protein [Actinomycetota bacterium]MSX72234.1 hypothetical protein [Actinomycetota bacterium]MSY69958.1 hypothetical protein [Actinomycetota bacterium]MTA76295.1 hypothetical protein [Actinomycetota bacterium]
MRKALRVLAIALSLALVVSVAQAAVKAGSACSKLGATSTVGGKKYTCIKSGKKQVWNKGVVVVAPKPTSSASATDRASATTFKAGDVCTSTGETIKSGTKSLICLEVVGRKFEFVDVTTMTGGLASQNSPSDFSLCRIPDSRVTKIQRASIAFPAVPDDSTFSSTSTITIGIVPIDFSDSPGTVDPKTVYERVMTETDEWAKWFTRGRLKVKWVVYPNWIRAPKTSGKYNWIHPMSMTSQVQDNSHQVGQDLIDLTESNLDISTVQDLLFIYPPNITGIKDSINYQSGMQTKNGMRMLGIYATSVWSYQQQDDLAMWLMHENMHRFGYAGHSPSYPLMFSIAANQAGGSHTMNLWDRVVLDWIDKEDIYCVDKNILTKSDISLVPQEREQNGVQGVAIKLSDHELLVLESHKKDKWSQGYSDNFYGITAMYVDTTRDTDRSGENFGDDLKGTKFSRTATYIQFTQYNHGDSSNNFSGGNFEMNYLLHQGEFFEFMGVRVEFVKAGYNDTIQIRKVN